MPLLEVSRETWRACLPSGSVPTIQHPANAVFVTFTDTEPCKEGRDCARIAQQIQKSQLEKGLPDISYNFLVGGDGNTYIGRGWFSATKPPLDKPGFDGRTIVIAKIGPPTVPDPCRFMERAVGSIIDYGYRRRYVDDDTDYYFRCNPDDLKEDTENTECTETKSPSESPQETYVLGTKPKVIDPPAPKPILYL